MSEATFAGLKALIPHERTWKDDEYADHPEQCPRCYAERLEKRVEEWRDELLAESHKATLAHAYEPVMGNTQAANKLTILLGPSEEPK